LSKNFIKIELELKKKINFGSSLVILQECLLLSKLYKKKNIVLNIIGNKINKNIFFIRKFLKFKFIITRNKNFKSDVKLNQIIKKKNYYSYLLINKIFEIFKIFPIFEFNNNVIKNIKYLIKKKKLNRFVTIHMKHDKLNKIANANIFFWKKVINFFLDKNFKVVIVGSQENEKFFVNLKNIFCCFENKIDLVSQGALIHKSEAFIGNASGFCCFANFSRVPQLVIKHPKHHKSEIFKEIKNNKLLFSKKNQYFVLENQSFNKIKKYLNAVQK